MNYKINFIIKIFFLLLLRRCFLQLPQRQVRVQYRLESIFWDFTWFSTKLWRQKCFLCLRFYNKDTGTRICLPCLPVESIMPCNRPLVAPRTFLWVWPLRLVPEPNPNGPLLKWTQLHRPLLFRRLRYRLCSFWWLQFIYRVYSTLIP